MASSSSLVCTLHLPRSFSTPFLPPPQFSSLLFPAFSSSQLPPPSPLRLRPLSLSRRRGRTLFATLSSSPPLPPSPPPPSPPSPSPLQLSGDLLQDDRDDESDLEVFDEMPERNGAREAAAVAALLPKFPSPILTVKEKKELASYAHSLGKKLKTQQVGKSGITAAVTTSFVENLESNELLKIKVHGSCPEELSDAVKLLEQATGSVAVGQIGRSVILYRPSLSKTRKKEAQDLKTSSYVKYNKFSNTRRKEAQNLKTSSYVKYNKFSNTRKKEAQDMKTSSDVKYNKFTSMANKNKRMQAPLHGRR